MYHPQKLPMFSPLWKPLPNGWWAYIGEEKEKVRPHRSGRKRCRKGNLHRTDGGHISCRKGNHHRTRTHVRPPVSEEEEVRPPVSEEEEEEVWPPVWKPVEKSPLYHFIGDHLRFGVDDFADVYPPGSEGHELIKRFLQQVRESRGYDVDCNPPRIANSPFYSWPIEDVMNSGEMYPMMEAQMKFVIGKINAQAEKHGEYYVLGKLEKVVGMSYFRTDLLTFTVKQVVPNPDVVKTVQAMVFHAGILGFELREWRFKP